MELGKIGAWAGLDAMTANEAAAFAQRIEAMGYSALWIPEAVGRDPFSQIGYLAASTEKESEVAAVKLGGIDIVKIEVVAVGGLAPSVEMRPNAAFVLIGHDIPQFGIDTAGTTTGRDSKSCGQGDRR